MNYQRRLCSTSFLSDDCGGRGNEDNGAGAGRMTRRQGILPSLVRRVLPLSLLMRWRPGGKLGSVKVRRELGDGNDFFGVPLHVWWFARMERGKERGRRPRKEMEEKRGACILNGMTE
ncbi:hypothetical protein VPH35_020790 [Triticum aestivum]